MKIKTISVIISLMIFSNILFGCSKENDDLSEKTVAVEIDTISSTAATLELNSQVKEIMTFTTLEAAIASVESKATDYLVTDEFSSALYLENSNRLERVKVLQYTTDFHIYFNKGSAFKEKLDEAIFYYTENGEIQKIKESYKNNEDYKLTLKKLPESAPTIVVGMEIVGKPYSDLSDEGYVYGIDVDIASLLANYWGYNLEIVVTDFDKIFELLSNDEVDFIMSGMVYEEARLIDYDCSFAYVSENYEMLKRKR